jgi:DNA-binding TFAR19-related protein (PDSD5 family)
VARPGAQDRLQRVRLAGQPARQIMQMTSMGVLNRKIDDQIMTELNTAR